MKGAVSTVTSRRDGVPARHALGLVALVILLVALLLDPHGRGGHAAMLGLSIPTTCGFRLLTGMPCPSCGMTRSVCLTVRGQLGSAFGLHPLGPVFTLAMVLQVAFSLLSLALPRVRDLPVSANLGGWAYGALIMAIFVTGTVRLLGWFPWPPV